MILGSSAIGSEFRLQYDLINIETLHVFKYSCPKCTLVEQFRNEALTDMIAILS